ncbi:tetratricopeptide repeat protein [uncultured Paraglaciecola sp.]|uniref:tetratricopeptide repeat protein n=1 Tax=uncultured Paraglaciecola sp. TaxID=1765024 RepID=UPI002608A883|nr:SEL1-like repeat protein [uncultured Paraglaciecola sp.]
MHKENTPQAVQKGYADAQNNLGYMYQNGKGVAQDDKQAVFWYRKAVEQGYKRAKEKLKQFQ